MGKETNKEVSGESGEVKESKKVLVYGNGTGAKIVVRLGEVPEMYANMKKVSGFANNDPASKFGADVRLVKTVKEEVDEQPELLKTEDFKTLEKEFNALREKDSEKQPSEIIKEWKNGKDYLAMVKDFNEQMNEYYKTKVEFHFRSHLKPDDFKSGAISDAAVAETLADFWKEELK